MAFRHLMPLEQHQRLFPVRNPFTSKADFFTSGSSRIWFCILLDANETKHRIVSLITVQQGKFWKRLGLKCFFGKLKSASWNGFVILISTSWLAAVDCSTCRWIGRNFWGLIIQKRRSEFFIYYQHLTSMIRSNFRKFKVDLNPSYRMLLNFAKIATYHSYQLLIT